MAATTAQRVNGTTVIAHRTVYSPCTICQQPGQRTPLWQVKAERVVYDQTKHKVRFRNAIVEVKGVPVVWLPTVSMVDPTVRYASGLVDAGSRQFHQDRLLHPPARLYRSVFQPGHDGRADDLHPGRRGAGEGISPALEQWRVLAAGQRRLQSRWRSCGNAGAQTYGHIFGSGRQQLGDDWRGGFDVQPPTTAPICASTTSPSWTG